MDTAKKHLHQTLICFGSLFAALFFDLLFYRKPIGISLGIFTTVLVIITFALVRARLANTNPDNNSRTNFNTANTNSTNTCKTKIEKYSILLGICTIGFSFLTTFRSSTILTTLNTIIVFLTYSLLVVRLTGEDLRRFELFNYLCLPLELVLKSLRRSSLIIKDLSSGRSELVRDPLFKQIARGSLYALPLLLLFLWLFASADLVFEKYIFTAVDLFKNFDFAGHIPLIAIVSLIIAGLMVYLTTSGDSLFGIIEEERKALIITRILSYSKPAVFSLLLLFLFISPVIVIIGVNLLIFMGFDLVVPITYNLLFALSVSFILILGYLYVLYRFRLNDQAVCKELCANEQTANPANKDFASNKQTSNGIDNMDSVITCNLRYFTWIESSIILGSICLVFLAFVYLQFAYLFNGNASISTQGFTYAEYAHRGFFELLIASLFSFIILCFASTRTVTENKPQSSILKFLSIMLIGGVAVIMVSAYKRLDIYEMAYGFTILRVYTQLFIILLGFVFLALLAKIIVNRNMPWLSSRLVGIVVLFIIWMNVYNPDQVIAKRNLGQYKVTNKYDVLVYNTGLSADAIDEIIISCNLLDKKASTKELSLASVRNLKKRMLSDKNELWMSYNLAKQYEIKKIESFAKVK